MRETQAPLFPLGRVYATRGVLDLLIETGMDLAPFLARHAKGDWGDLGDEDRAANAESLVDGTRLLSAYELPGDGRLWIITEADRSSTMLLLPEEY